MIMIMIILIVIVIMIMIIINRVPLTQTGALAGFQKFNLEKWAQPPGDLNFQRRLSMTNAEYLKTATSYFQRISFEKEVPSGGSQAGDISQASRPVDYPVEMRRQHVRQLRSGVGPPVTDLKQGQKIPPHYQVQPC